MGELNNRDGKPNNRDGVPNNRGGASHGEPNNRDEEPNRRDGRWGSLWPAPDNSFWAWGAQVGASMSQAQAQGPKGFSIGAGA